MTADEPRDGRSRFSEVEKMVLARRFKEAAGALKLSARAGAQTWETFIWLGRIEESRGRLDEAERSFRRALEANPASPLPRVELSRLLEKTGRPEESQEILREAAAQAAGELSLLSDDALQDGRAGSAGERLYSLMEFNLYRRVFLESVVERGEDLARVETAMRAVLRSVPHAGARTLLAEILIARGRLKEAEAELAAAFRPESAGAETSRLEVLFKLIARGRFGAVLERALLECVSRAASDSKLALEWPQIFSALMCEGRYRAAFRLGETVLDRFGRFESPGLLLWPWWRKIRRAVTENRFLARELARMRSAAKPGDFPHWFAYYRAVLLSDLGRNREAQGEYKRIRALDAERYSWMFQSFVLVKLGMQDYAGAAAICRDVLKRAPSHWWVRCRMAEALLAQGRTAEGLEEFARARTSAAEPSDRREVLTWNGEILLWLGDYDGALALLDEAVALGARTFVHGWRGAAHLKRGDFAKALADLDRAVALDPKDLEARCWRGEAYRLQGRNAESVKDLDAVISAAPTDFWAHVNRALARDALGDEAGLRADAAAIPQYLAAFLRETLGLRPGADLSAEETRRLLTAALERSRGVRRWELYVQAIWTGPRP